MRFPTAVERLSKPGSRPASSRQGRTGNSILKLVLISFAVCWQIDARVFADPNWPAFRGPSGQGVTAEASLPVTWSESSNVTWKTSVPGRGWSSPVIWGNDIWMTTAVERTPTDEEKKELLKGDKQASQKQVAKSISLRAVCVDRTSGKTKQDVELFEIENPDSIHLLNSYASPTPVIEQGRLYCHFGTFGTACLDTNTGKKLWERRLQTKHSVGPGSSPVLWRDLLVLVCDGTEEQFVTALNKSTGDEVWKTPRPPMSGSQGEMHKAFCTPLAIEWDGVPQLITPGAQWFVSYNPETGKPLWKINHGKGFSNVPVPVFANGISYLVTGFMKAELWAVPVSSRGELSSDDVLWEQKRQIPKMSSPALAGDAVYVVNDSGVLSCIDIHSGDIRWSSRLGGNFSASPLVAGDSASGEHIYFCGQDGKTTVVRPNLERAEIVAENELDGRLMASPVVSDGALFMRTDTHLYRLEEN